MKNEEKIKEKILNNIDKQILSLEKEIKSLKNKKDKILLVNDNSSVFANGQTYDIDEENLLVVQVGMSFSNKYGEQGKIVSINEDRKSVKAINLETNKEEEFSIERFNSCYWE